MFYDPIFKNKQDPPKWKNKNEGEGDEFSK